MKGVKAARTVSKDEPLHPFPSTVDLTSAAVAANRSAFAPLISTLRERLGTSLAGGGAAMVDRHRLRGKMLVRDRIDLLLDVGSPFLELSPLAAHGLYGGDVAAAGSVTGIGLVYARPCMLSSHGGTVNGGEVFAEMGREPLIAQELGGGQPRPRL